MARKRLLTQEEIQVLMEQSEDEDDDDGQFSLSNLIGDEGGWSSDVEPDHVLPELIDSSSDEETVDDDEPSTSNESPKKRKLSVKKRLVCNLNQSLNPSNYDKCDPPSTDNCVEYTSILEKGGKNNPDKTITWTNQPPISRGRQSAANIKTVDGPKVLGEARHANTPAEAWECFFTPKMVDDIVTCTNMRLKKYRDKLGEKINQLDDKSYLKDTDSVEIRAFISLTYARGLFGQNMHNIELLWHPGFGHDIFRGVMSRKRFAHLHQHLAFDDESTREERWSHDRFAAMREFLVAFNKCAGQVRKMYYLYIDFTLNIYVICTYL